LNSGTWASGAGGPKVKEFEQKFAQYLGCKKVIAVNSGTAALHLGLFTVPEINGKEVILPSMTFASTALAVIHNGGIPVFGDIDEKTMCLDPDSVEITNKTACVIPVHFGGYPASTDYSCSVFQDCAHACGTTMGDKKIGSFGMSAFSFHPIKNLAMPTGGAIALPGDFPVLESLRWCGITDRKGARYDVSMPGWNYYMNEISASIGLVQLKKLDSMNNWRQRIAKEYCERLEVPHMPWNEGCCYHLFWIRVKHRDYFMDKMRDAGIETGIHYQPLHKMSLFNTGQSLPVTERVAKEIVSIPMHPGLKTTDVDKIISTISSLV